MAFDAGRGIGIGGFPVIGLAGADGDQLVAAAHQGCERGTGGMGILARFEREGLAHMGEHCRIDPVGLGDPAGGAGKVASAGGVDPHMGDPGIVKRDAQCPVIAAARLEDDKTILGQARGEPDESLRPIWNPAGAAARIKNVEMGFADIDSDVGVV